MSRKANLICLALAMSAAAVAVLWCNYVPERTLSYFGTSADNKILYIIDDNKTCVIVVDRSEKHSENGTTSVVIEVVPIEQSGMYFRDLSKVTPFLVKERVFDDSKEWNFTWVEEDKQMNTVRYRIIGKPK